MEAAGECTHSVSSAGEPEVVACAVAAANAAAVKAVGAEVTAAVGGQSAWSPGLPHRHSEMVDVLDLIEAGLVELDSAEWDLPEATKTAEGRIVEAISESTHRKLYF